MPARRELLGVPGKARDAADLLLLLREDERDADAATARAAGAADAVHVAGCSSGGSKLTTWVISTRSSPRAATSVATSVVACPLSNRLSARSRWRWFMSPCNETASTPW